MTRLAIWLAAGACALTLASACGRRGTGYAVLTPAELQQQLAAHDSLVIVDVREPAEFAARHIPGARLIPYQAARDRVLQALQRQDHVVFVCHDGPMGAELAQILVAHGYPFVANLKGGMAAWTGPSASDL
jgi:rhodanese-related sulfurtransferase